MGLVGETFGGSLSMGNHRTCRALASIATSKRLECRASSPGWREPGDRPNKAKTTAPCNVDEITKLSRLGAPGYSFRLLTLAPPQSNWEQFHPLLSSYIGKSGGIHRFVR